jgi:tetratricopeptide (TPR) repeat protein
VQALIFVLLLSPFATRSAASSAVDEATRLLETYHEDPARLDRARDLLEAVLAREARAETITLLARVYFQIGDVRATAVDDKLAAYDRGRALGRRAIDLAPQSEDAHFWYMANTGRWGQTKGIMRSMFLLGTVRETMDTLLAMNPRSARTHAAAAAMYFELPRIAGGDRARSREHWRRAFELDPRYTSPKVDHARDLIDAGRYDDARRELEAVLDERQPRIRADWAMKDVPRARRLLESIRDRR